MATWRQTRLLHTATLALLIVLTGVRFKVNDPHGALIMMLVCLLGILGILFDSERDMSCCKNCGVMAVIGGVLDLSIAVETLGRSPWPHVLFREPLSPLAVLVLSQVAYACAQFAWAAMCYKLCSDASEDDELWESDVPFFASQEDARVYGAAMSWSQRRQNSSSERAATEAQVSFSGASHKLP